MALVSKNKSQYRYNKAGDIVQSHDADGWIGEDFNGDIVVTFQKREANSLISQGYKVRAITFTSPYIKKRMD
jgi:hypothetical protein